MKSRNESEKYLLEDKATYRISDKKKIQELKFNKSTNRYEYVEVDLV